MSEPIPSNAAAVVSFFKARGLTAYQAAAIAGNLWQESLIQPAAVQSGPGRGVAMWSVGQRWDALVAYERAAGRDPMSLDAQLDYIWHELTTQPALGLAQLKAAPNVEAATRAFQNLYERCGVCNEPRRIALSQAVFAKFGGDSESGNAYVASGPSLGQAALLIAGLFGLAGAGIYYAQKSGLMRPKPASYYA